MASQNYTFRPVEDADLPMLDGWLKTPEIRRWWGDPREQFGLIEKDMNDDRMATLLVLLDNRPFAYLQHYDVRSWPQKHLEHLPAGTRAIDTFIGEPAMIGTGHGSTYLRAMAGMLIDAGANGVVIDPEPHNDRARKAYFKAGFTKVEERMASDGPAIVMHFVPTPA